MISISSILFVLLAPQTSVSEQLFSRVFFLSLDDIPLSFGSISTGVLLCWLYFFFLFFFVIFGELL